MVRPLVFGKIPAYGDFVVESTGTALFEALREWVARSAQRVEAEGGRLPAVPAGFCYCDPSLQTMAVGIMIASADRVGRRFPLVLGIEVDCSEVEGCAAREPWLAGVPQAMSVPLQGMSRVALRSRLLSVSDVRTRVAAVRMPTDSQARQWAATEVSRLRCARVEGFVVRRGRRADVADFDGVVGALRRSTQAGGTRALEFEVRDPIQMLFWLTCFEGGLSGRKIVPSAVWKVASGRMVVFTGPPDANALGYLGQSAPAGGLVRVGIIPLLDESGAPAERSGQSALDVACGAGLRWKDADRFADGTSA